MGAPAPAGLFATFRPKEDDPARTELFLEQPWGDVTLDRLTQAEVEAAQKQSPPTELLALVGAYRPKDKLTEVRLEAVEGRVSLVIPGQPPYPLLRRQEDEFGLGGLPATFALTLRRDEHGAVTGFAVKEPGVTLDHQRVGPRGVPDIPIDVLERRVAQAHGAERLARLKTLVLAGTVDFVHEGVTGTLAIYREVPEHYAEVTVFQAFARDIGRARVVFDGERAADSVDFAPIGDPYPAEADDIRVRAWFNPYEDWKTWFPSVRVVGHSQVGREDVIVVGLERASGVKLTEYYSKKTYLLRKRERLVPGLPGRFDRPTATTTEVYDDYRQVAGVMIPHRIEAETWNGKVVTVIREAQPNAPIPPGTFALPNSKNSVVVHVHTHSGIGDGTFVNTRTENLTARLASRSWRGAQAGVAAVAACSPASGGGPGYSMGSAASDSNRLRSSSAACFALWIRAVSSW